MKLNARTDPAVAASFLEHLCPSEPARMAWAELVADSIGVASAVSPLSWELTVFPYLVRLNVGQIAVLELWERNASLYVHGDVRAEAAPGCRQYTEWLGYAAVPGPNQRWRISSSALLRLSPSIRAAHHRLVELAASKKPRSPFMRAHSPGMVAVIEALLRSQLPQRSPHSGESDLGTGFGSAEENREIELAAIGAVTSHYEAAGWVVESVERAKIGYDLLCRRAKEEIHVEVKGAGAPADRFLLTAAEFRAAFSDDTFVLALVDGITSVARVRLWSAKDFRRLFEFEAVQYWACLRSTPGNTGPAADGNRKMRGSRR